MERYVRFNTQAWLLHLLTGPCFLFCNFGRYYRKDAGHLPHHLCGSVWSLVPGRTTQIHRSPLLLADGQDSPISKQGRAGHRFWLSAGTYRSLELKEKTHGRRRTVERVGLEEGRGPGIEAQDQRYTEPVPTGPDHQDACGRDGRPHHPSSRPCRS
jgi:hypothetical protein